MSLPAKVQPLLASFNTANSWEQKMRLLMQLGTTLAPLADHEKTISNQVQGCESQVWLIAAQNNGVWQFKAYSEARLIKGLLAIVLARINGLTNEQIQQIDLADWFGQLGLSKQLSSSRRDGLNAIWQRIKSISQT